MLSIKESIPKDHLQDDGHPLKLERQTPVDDGDRCGGTDFSRIPHDKISILVKEQNVFHLSRIVSGETFTCVARGRWCGFCKTDLAARSIPTISLRGEELL